MIRVFSIYGKVDGNTGIMTISQGIDNEFVMDCHKILQPKSVGYFHKTELLFVCFSLDWAVSYTQILVIFIYNIKS